MEELIDVLDEYGNKTGIVKPKIVIKKDGDYHRAISVCFINSLGDVLLQKRSFKKKVYPNLWTMFLKGHVQSGEDSLSAAIREIKEELGLVIKCDELIYLYTIKEEKNNEDYIEKIFFDTYLVIKNIDIKDIKLNDEVSDIAFVSYEMIKNAILENNCNIAPNSVDYEKIIPLLDKQIKTKRMVKK